MERILSLLIPVLLAAGLIRMLMLPLRLGLKLALHSGCGFLCLWLLNTAADLTGVLFPINAVTVSAAGLLGLPGIGLLALLEVMG